MSTAAEEAKPPKCEEWRYEHKPHEFQVINDLEQVEVHQCPGRFIFKGSAAERKAIVKLFDHPDFDDYWTMDMAASKIIEKLDEMREESRRYVVVAQLELGGIYHLFASGPYNTITQANNAGPGFAWSGRTGKGRWKIAPILATPRKAWDFLIEQEASHGPKPWGWIKNEEGRWMWNKKEFASENPDIERELNEWSWRATKDLDKGGW